MLSSIQWIFTVDFIIFFSNFLLVINLKEWAQRLFLFEVIIALTICIMCVNGTASYPLWLLNFYKFYSSSLQINFSPLSTHYFWLTRNILARIIRRTAAFRLQQLLSLFAACIGNVVHNFFFVGGWNVIKVIFFGEHYTHCDCKVQLGINGISGHLLHLSFCTLKIKEKERKEIICKHWIMNNMHTT